MSEAVMMGLPYIGRNQAHHVVFDACARATAGLSLKQAIMEDPHIIGKLGESHIDKLIDPANYLE